MLDAIADLGYKPRIAPSKVKISRDTLNKGLKWVKPQVLESAFTKADAANKLVFIDFFAEWCGACKALDATTLKDADVKSALTHYIFTKLDTDQYPDTARHFEVVGMPTLVVLDATGRELYRHVGFIEADQLSLELSAITDH